MDIQFLKQKEKELNKIIKNIWDIGKKEISEELGYKVNLEFVDKGEYDIEKILIISIPRPCGCCVLNCNEYLTINTPNLKEIISKLKEVEKLVVNFDDSYEYMYTITIPCTIKEILEKTSQELFELWKGEYNYE